MRTDSDHTSSYYAATANEQTDYARLHGDTSADVVVVGGGFTGLSAAIALAEKGFDVVVLEARRIGWGASGRNGGQLIDGFVEPGKLRARLGEVAESIAWDMGVACREVVVDRVERYGIDCDLRFGYIDLAMNRKDVSHLRAEQERRARRGYPHEVTFVPREELADYVGSDRFIAGLVNHGNGHLHPLNLCIGEARAAASLGVRIHEQTRVTGVRHGSRPVVHTESGSVSSELVVLAGNAYLGTLEKRLSGAVIPAGSYIIATEPLDAVLADELLPQRTAACDQRLSLDYFRLSADRRMLFGGQCNYSGRDPRDIAASLKPKMLKVFPQLAGKRIDYQWGGYIGISINRIPQLGRIDDNLYYAQGYSGHGLAPSHLAGVVLADAIAGDTERFDVFARIRHLRLPGGRWFANPALALGMLYYRLKELL